MKSIFFRSILILLFITSILITYLSVFGFETSKFNSEISKQIKNLNKDLEIDLKKIKIVLNLFEFKFYAKTISPTIRYRNKIIEIDRVKTQISINSLYKNEFLLDNLVVSTKSLEIKNFISFTRAFRNDPKLYILEKLIENGYLIADFKVEFDKNGKIKNNYNIQGFIKDLKVSIFDKYDISNLNFNFKLNHNKYTFTEIKSSLNTIPISSDEIIIKKKDKKYIVSGNLSNNKIDLKKKEIKLLLKPYFKKLNIEKISLESKNKFSFNIGKKFTINDLSISSEMKLINLLILSNLKLDKFLPNFDNKINLFDQIIKVNYSKKKLSINGKGPFLIQKNKDEINYTIIKANEKYIFKTSLKIKDNPFKINLLNYEKKDNSEITLKFNGTSFTNKYVQFDLISLDENKNQIKIKDLVFNKNLKIEELKNVKSNYLDKDNIKNQFDLIKEKNGYLLLGKSFNADKLIENLLDEKNVKNDFFGKNFDLNFNLEKVYLDIDSSIKKLQGKLSFVKNELSNGNLNALFSQDKKFRFTVKSDINGKVTTLFLDKAEPIIKRYKFVKGYENGSLDFYSLKKNNESISTLKIYDFKLKKLPVLTKILTLASLQGIADILSGEGIRFDEFEMNFRNKGNLMTIKEIYAIGPAISIMMEGYVEKNKVISLRGTLVPATTINKVIGSIPVLGKILVGKKTGEGVFGVSFKVKGPPKKLETTVNPIKTLTPRFITRTLEKIKNN